MPTPTYTVTLLGIASDGSNLFLEVSISNGTTTMQTIRPVFDVSTTAATITAYLQAIATARPTLSTSIAALVGSSVTG
jgi:hypothetical protein